MEEDAAKVVEQTAEIVDWLSSSSMVNPAVVGAGEIVGALDIVGDTDGAADGTSVGDGLGAVVGNGLGAEEGAELGWAEAVGRKLGAGETDGWALIVGDAVGCGVIMPLSSMPPCSERRPETCEYPRRYVPLGAA